MGSNDNAFHPDGESRRGQTLYAYNMSDFIQMWYKFLNY